MTLRNPPRIATWFLNRFYGCDQALVGDMIEEYRRGRSRLWYWRQTWIAVFRAAAADGRAHPVLALRAFLLLWVYILCYGYFLLRPFQVFYSDLMLKLDPFLFSSTKHPVGKIFLVAYSLVPAVLIPCIGYVTGARLVARFHRLHETSFTLLNAALIFFVGTLQLFWWVEHANAGPFLQWLGGGASLRGFRFYVCFRCVMLLLFVMSTLVGGLWKHQNRAPLQLWDGGGEHD